MACRILRRLPLHVPPKACVRRMLNATASLTGNAASSLPKVIVVTGPTAVGKSATGLLLAKELNGEIISADSVQVYTGLDVGSDKVPLSTRGEIVHHLIDVLSPSEEFTAGDFYSQARVLAEDIIQRGKVPIVVGGTGFYLRWFVCGRPETPRSTPEATEAVDQQVAQAWAAAEQGKGEPLTEEEQWAAAVQLLAETGDAEAVARIGAERNNYYRLKRALIIMRERPGKTLAEMLAEGTGPPPYDFRCFFLHRPRIALWQGILQRCEQMVAGGLLPEAAWLLSVGLGPRSCQGARAIGYSQALDFLQACKERGGVTPADVQQLVFDIATATRQLVKAQLTWFRDDTTFQWVDATVGPEAVAQHILQEIQQLSHQGGCGDSGRLSKEDQRLIKLYRPTLGMLADKQGAPMQEVLSWVQAWIEETGGQLPPQPHSLAAGVLDLVAAGAAAISPGHQASAASSSRADMAWAVPAATAGAGDVASSAHADEAGAVPAPAAGTGDVASSAHAGEGGAVPAPAARVGGGSADSAKSEAVPARAAGVEEPAAGDSASCTTAGGAENEEVPAAGSQGGDAGTRRLQLASAGLLVLMLLCLVLWRTRAT